ncbi:MAG: multicopper oxidase family protein [Phycisphaerae bacterium]|nr:multicopper oxidase family protein [Phycisphaerae bacterium]MBT6282350.1 multicopper oxidase family protein [Phycisphaerae bacterium]
MKTRLIIGLLTLAPASMLFGDIIGIDLNSSVSSQQILSGQPTITWRYTASVTQGSASTLSLIPNSYLGPIISLNTGDSVQIHQQNNLMGETTTHFHGLDIPEISDGHPKDAFDSGESYDYEFIVRNRAGTYWYHPHPDMMTGQQVYMGLKGFLIVSDPQEQALDLPRGEFDLPLCIHDADFTNDNVLVYSGANMMGHFGNTQLVNGQPNYNYSAATKAYRLRLLNGSQSRILKLAFDDGTPIIVIGVDGGLLEAPEEYPYLLMGPGERYELWADFSDKTVGDRVILNTLAYDETAGGIGQGDELEIMRFTIDRAEVETLTLPSTLVPMGEVYDVADIQDEKYWPITFEGGMFLLNGAMWDMTDMTATLENERAPGDTLELITMTNHEGNIQFAHPMHFHGRQFQIHSRSMVDPDSIDAYNTVKDGIVDSGWQDTFMIMPNETVQFLVRWSRHPGLFMWHCHNLPHEDMGMMRNFLLSEVSCPADLTHDGVVNISDFLEIIANWDSPFGDVTGDDKTDVADILATIADWGICDAGFRELPRPLAPYKPNNNAPSKPKHTAPSKPSIGK